MVTCSVNAHAAAPSATIFEVPVICNGRAVPRCGGLANVCRRSWWLLGRARDLPETALHATSSRPTTPPSTGSLTCAVVWARTVREVLEAGLPVAEVADRDGVSRQSVHTWVNRYRAGGLAGLAGRSHRPNRCPHQLAAAVEAKVCQLRRQHPGPTPERYRGCSSPSPRRRTTFAGSSPRSVASWNPIRRTPDGCHDLRAAAALGGSAYASRLRRWLTVRWRWPSGRPLRPGSAGWCPCSAGHGRGRGGRSWARG